MFVVFEESARLANLSRHLRTPRCFRWASVLPRRAPDDMEVSPVYRAEPDRRGAQFLTRADIFGVLAALGLTPCRGRDEPLNPVTGNTPAYKRLFRILNHYTAHVVTNSAYAKKVVAAAEKLAPDKITVLYTEWISLAIHLRPAIRPWRWPWGCPSMRRWWEWWRIIAS